MGGKGSGGARHGAGRPHKLPEHLEIYVINRLETLVAAARRDAEDAAYRRAAPETAAQYSQMFAAEDGLTMEERAKRRATWLRMPVGRGHMERFNDAQDNDYESRRILHGSENEDAIRLLSVTVKFSKRRALAAAKRQVLSELESKFERVVHMRTISRIWHDWQAEGLSSF